MNIRLIAGFYGGRILDGSGTRRTHPMSERIRNALFNSIQAEIPGATVLDAFAGSGAIGLEALSRGAKEVTLVDKDRIAQKIIAKNIVTLGVEEQVSIVRANVGAWLKTIDQQFDIIFADPPYHDPQIAIIKSLFGLLEPNGLLVLSYADDGEVPKDPTVKLVDTRGYGNACLAYYRKKG